MCFMRAWAAQAVSFGFGAAWCASKMARASSSESASMMARAARRPAPGLVFHSPHCKGACGGSGSWDRALSSVSVSIAGARARPIRVVTARRQDSYAKKGIASPKTTIPPMIAHVGSHGATLSAPTPLSRSTTSAQMTIAILMPRHATTLPCCRQPLLIIPH